MAWNNEYFVETLGAPNQQPVVQRTGGSGAADRIRRDHRHAGRRYRHNPSPAGSFGRVRLPARTRARMGYVGQDPSQLRTDGALRHAPGPGHDLLDRPQRRLDEREQGRAHGRRHSRRAAGDRGSQPGEGTGQRGDGIRATGQRVRDRACGACRGKRRLGFAPAAFDFSQELLQLRGELRLWFLRSFVGQE